MTVLYDTARRVHQVLGQVQNFRENIEWLKPLDDKTSDVALSLTSDRSVLAKLSDCQPITPSLPHAPRYGSTARVEFYFAPLDPNTIIESRIFREANFFYQIDSSIQKQIVGWVPLRPAFSRSLTMKQNCELLFQRLQYPREPVLPFPQPVFDENTNLVKNLYPKHPKKSAWNWDADNFSFRLTMSKTKSEKGYKPSHEFVVSFDPLQHSHISHVLVETVTDAS